jgi:hypothetical protein
MVANHAQPDVVDALGARRVAYERRDGSCRQETPVLGGDVTGELLVLEIAMCRHAGFFEDIEKLDGC